MHTYRFVVNRVAPILLLITAVLAFGPSTSNAQLKDDDFTIRVGGTGSFVLSPSLLSDSYSFGRGANVGVDVFMGRNFDLQTELEFTQYAVDNYSFSNVGGSVAPASSLNGGTITRKSFSAGVKWTFSRSGSFESYIRGVGSLTRLEVTNFVVDGAGSAPNFIEQGFPTGEKQFATGFTTGIGFLFPMSYTTAVFLEPSYTVEYGEFGATVQAFDVRFGILLGKF